MIIIPDIHGRTFWKDVINGREEQEITFLGDYSDPYATEGITDDDAIANFKEILSFKKAHPKNVTLLIGNHDQHYLSNDYSKGSRYCFQQSKEYQKLLTENRKDFRLCTDFTTEYGKYVIISHAGISRGWKDMFFKDIDDKKLVDFLNNSYLVEDEKLPFYLSCISFYRWGDSPFGSITWADINELASNNNTPFVGDFQIFGHTQLQSNPLITENFACLDVRRGFEVDKNCKIIRL